MGHTLEPSVDPVLHPVSDQDSRVIYVFKVCKTSRFMHRVSVES